MVARLVRDEEVVGSNPAIPTKGQCRNNAQAKLRHFCIHAWQYEM